MVNFLWKTRRNADTKSHHQAPPVDSQSANGGSAPHSPVHNPRRLCTPAFRADRERYSWENRKAPEGYGFGGRPPTCSNRKGSADMLPITDQIALIRSIASSAEGRESDALDEVRAVLNGAGIDQLIALRRAVK